MCSWLLWNLVDALHVRSDYIYLSQKTEKYFLKTDSNQLANRYIVDVYKNVPFLFPNKSQYLPESVDQNPNIFRSPIIHAVRALRRTRNDTCQAHTCGWPWYWFSNQSNTSFFFFLQPWTLAFLCQGREGSQKSGPDNYSCIQLVWEGGLAGRPSLINGKTLCLVRSREMGGKAPYRPVFQVDPDGCCVVGPSG